MNQLFNEIRMDNFLFSNDFNELKEFIRDSFFLTIYEIQAFLSTDNFPHETKVMNSLPKSSLLLFVFACVIFYLCEAQ